VINGISILVLKQCCLHVAAKFWENVHSRTVEVCKFSAKSKSVLHSQTSKGHTAAVCVQKRSVAGARSDWQSPVSAISLIQLNRSITDDYCVSTDCRPGSREARFNAEYQLSLHPNFPLAFVTLQFE